MAILTRAQLKALWVTGYTPTQSDYHDLFDSVMKNTEPFIASPINTDLVADVDIDADIGAVEDYIIDNASNRIMAYVGVAPVGSSIIIDIKKNGVSIFSTPISIDDGEKTSLTASVPYVLTSSSISFSRGDQITATITQVGASTPGQNLSIYLDYLKA
jgi:hypothetical protein